ncbi:MAG TPA: hypothetical protein DIT93_07035 [Pelagibacterium sp.]|uniref:hypothetical protein n=1 Tax=uncultured Pelagibacterium sp. TaxID=1159875 RepID=UPI000ED1C0A6|nr:hypothetical protein [Pelagibacterium sp.]
MDAHRQLMEKLYLAGRQGGSSLSLTQLMRMVYPEVAHLRALHAPWAWIAARFARLIECGLEEPMPTSDLVDQDHKPVPTSSVRAAFARVGREAALRPIPAPAARDGPERNAEISPVQAAPAPNGHHRSQVRRTDASDNFFSNLEKLRSQSS